MTSTAFILLLVSVFLHAAWNFLSKSHRPSAAFYCIASLTNCVVLLPFAFIAPFDWRRLGFGFAALLAGSIGFEVLYFIGLFNSYRRCDISLAYPLVRALPVLLVAFTGIVFGVGSELNATAWIGMGIVSAGCLLLPLRRFADFRPGAYLTPALGMILVAAAGNTGYTFIDSIEAARLAAAGHSGVAAAANYLLHIETGIMLGLGSIVLRRKDERENFRRLFLKSPMPNICGVFASLSYILVLLAMPLVSNVSYIQAFRQMSLPLGVAAGIFILKERGSAPKLCGVGMIMAGLIMLAAAK